MEDGLKYFRLLGACLIALSSTNVHAQARSIGLAPSVDSLGRAEAVTADTTGTDSLYYNPALLAFTRPYLRLVGVEASTGLETDKIKPPDGEKATLLDVFKFFSETDSVYVTLTARAVDLAVPYAGVSSFARGEMSVGEAEDEGFYDLNVRTDTGVIAGVAVNYRKLALGYSQYGLVRAEVKSKPSAEQIAAVVAADEAGTLDEHTVPIRDFTEVAYGGARGHNVGLMYRFFDDNPSGIGVSVLNVGGTEFGVNPPFDREDVDSWNERVKADAALHEIDLKLPDEIPQTTNAGLCLGWGGDMDDIIDARATAEYDDIGGELVTRKFAASWQLGLNLPDKLALATAWPIFNTNLVAHALGQKPSGKGSSIHMGLASLRAFGGYREKSYVSRGAGLGFHFGWEYKVSFLRLDIEAYERHPILDSGIVPEAGVRAILALTLMF